MTSLLLTTVLTYRDFLFVWPRHPRVRFAFQSSMTEALRYLDRTENAPPTVMAGLSPHDMDPWTERSTLGGAGRSDLDIRWVDARSALILPPGERAWLVTLDITPVDPALATWAGLDSAHILAEGEVVPRGGTEHQDEAPVYYDPAYTVYALDAETLRAKIALSASEDARVVAAVGSDAFAPTPLDAPPEFGGLVRLSGYWWTGPLRAGAPGQLLTFWEVLDTGPSATLYGEPALRTFVHLLDADQNVVAGVDVLGAAADTWRVGDTVAQLHSLTLPPQEGRYAVEIGWYVPPSGPRLPVGGGAPGDRVLLAPAVVR